MATRLVQSRGTMAEPEGCQCSCHTLPGIAHAVPCCDQPPFDELGDARIEEYRQLKQKLVPLDGSNSSAEIVLRQQMDELWALMLPEEHELLSSEDT